MDDAAQILKRRLPRAMIRLREIHGLTQLGLAEKAGVAASTINGLESGFAKDVNLTTLLAIAKALGASPDLMVGVDERPSRCGSCARVAEAITDQHDAGRGTAAIATSFGLHESSVQQILEAEYESRRLRRH